MKIICSYCRKDLGQKEPLEDQSVSHGLCDECELFFREQWHGQKTGEYLDRFDYPVLIVDGDVRIIAANQIMADMLGKTEREVFGLLGGEVFECKHARLEGGCGKTFHCQTCTLRILIQQTYLTGESFYRVPAHVDGDESRLEFYISTVKLDQSVQASIESLPASGENPERENPDE